ncbi:MAG: SufB/SufD family protein [Patescibacteria group bacterium]
MSKLPQDFIKTAKMCGIEHALGANSYLYIEKNKIISELKGEGIEFHSKETGKGAEAEIRIKSGVKIEEPLFFCFGILGKKDEQFIIPNIVLEDGAEVKIIAHCSFPHAQGATHNMEAEFTIGKNAKFFYDEHHYHGKSSGAKVYPKLNLNIKEGGEFNSNFVLTQGTVGEVGIEIEGNLGKKAKAALESKVLGKSAQDIINITEKINLNGAESKSLIKMRAAAKNGGRVLMQGETYAAGRDSMGHVDCQEIVVGKNSSARAVPIVEVSNDQARVTHEASVGKINQKELETLMTRGMDEEEATELIIASMMK